MAKKAFRGRLLISVRLAPPPQLGRNGKAPDRQGEDQKCRGLGHGLRAKRSKSSAISFELLELEAGHAAFQ